MKEFNSTEFCSKVKNLKETMVNITYDSQVKNIFYQVIRDNDYNPTDVLNFLAEMEAGESEMLKNHAREAEMDKFSNEKLDAALPYLRKAFQLDVNHENNDIPTLLMQVLYRKFQPTGAQNKAALIQEYNDVAVAYGRPEYHK